MRVKTEMDSRKIRWGILGTGNMARKFIRELQAVPGAVCTAVASRSGVRAEAFAKEFGVSRSYDGYGHVATDLNVDVVYIATMNNLHMELSQMCLESGKHVLCEKPFALSADQAQRIISLARSQRLFFMEALWILFLPIIKKLREIVRSGELGQVRLLTANFCAKKPFNKDSRFFSPQLGGGALNDLGIYPVSISHSLLGPPKRISSQAFIGGSNVDNQSAVLLGYEKGAIAVLHESFETQTDSTISVFGTKAVAHLIGPIFRPQWIVINQFGDDYNKNQKENRWLSWVKQSTVLNHLGMQMVDFVNVFKTKRRVIKSGLKGSGYQYEINEVCNCIRGGRLESGVIPWEETLSIAQTLDVIRSQWHSQ